MERLSGDYNRGYTKAIQDVIEVFEYIKGDLTSHRKGFSYGNAMDILKICLENREALRENMDGFVRWNTQKNSFEWYKPDKSRKDR